MALCDYFAVRSSLLMLLKHPARDQWRYYLVVLGITLMDVLSAKPKLLGTDKLKEIASKISEAVGKAGVNRDVIKY